MLNRFIRLGLLAFTLLPLSLSAQGTKADSLRQALKVAQEDTLKVYLRNELARMYINSKPDTALIVLNENFKIAGNNEFNGLMATTGLLCANAYNNLGQRDSAELYFKRTIQVATRHMRTTTEGLAYLGLGTCYNMWKKHNQALQNYLVAYKIYSSLGDSSKLASVALGIGNVYSDLNDLKKAQKYFVEALTSAISRKDNRFIAKCYNNLGNLFQRSKEYDKAFEYYTKSIEIKKLLNDEHGIANTYLNFGNIYTLTHKYDLAILFYNKANDIYLKLGDSATYMGCLTYLAECYLKESRINEGLKCLSIAEGICIRNHYTADLAAVYGAQTRVYIQQGDTSRARITLEKYTAVKDTLLTRDMQKQIAQMSAQFESDKVKQEQLMKDVEQAANKRIGRVFLVAGIALGLLLIVLLILILRLRKLRSMAQNNSPQHPGSK